MKGFYALIFTAFAVTAIAQTTVTLPAQSLTGKLADGSTVSVAIAAQTLTSTVVTPPPVIPPPVVTPPASGVLWVYTAGALNSLWSADWSFPPPAAANYKDTTGGLGVADILFTCGQYNCGWQPAIGSCQANVSTCLDTTKYKNFIMSIKPTVAGQQWQMGFMSSGDTPDGPVIDLTPYCGKAVVGAWAKCVAPIAAFKLTNPKVLKFWVQGSTQSARAWFMTDVGFSN